GGEADAPPGTHDGHEEGRARLRVVLEREHVLAHAAVVPVAAPDLLAARPARLALGALAPRPPRVLDQLVGAVEVGRVGRGDEARAEAEAVDRRAARDQVAQRVLVEVAAREDGDLTEPARIEDAPHPAGVLGQVAAVEAGPPHSDALARLRHTLRTRMHRSLGRD